MMENVAAVILAAGEGTRIGQRLPKALYPIAGKPMLHWTIDVISRIPLSDRYAVVGFRAEDVKASIGNHAVFVKQEQQLGTAHAVQTALAIVPPRIRSVLVMNADDSSFFEPSTLRAVIDQHQRSAAPITVVTLKTSHPEALGRIVRDTTGGMVKVIEEKDATLSEKKIQEVNAGCYVIDVMWANEYLPAIERSPNGEFYLTSAIEIAHRMRRVVGSYVLDDPKEWHGVNTQEELQDANVSMVKKLSLMNSPTVTVIDVDNTLLDTQTLKQSIPEAIASVLRKSLGREVSTASCAKTFWDVYEASRDRLGYISVPSIVSEFSERLSLSSADIVHNVLLSLPFRSYLHDGAVELLDFVRLWSKAVIFAEGDLVYQPVKVNALGLEGKYHDFYVAENQQSMIRDMVDIFRYYRLIVIDDQIKNLEAFESVKSSVKTILVEKGPYCSQKPRLPNFRPDYQVDSLIEVLPLLKKEVFRWG